SEFGFAKVILQHHADVVSTTAVTADCVNAIRRNDFRPPTPALGGVAKSAAHARVPMSGLFEAADVIHQRGARHGGHVPLFGRAEWDGVKAVSEPKIFRREFLKEVARQVQGKFR